MRFLDVAAIRPGDILVTAERQRRSKVIRIGQRLLHPQHFKTAGYSHAMVVVAPGIVFESTSEGGLRFNFLDYAVRQQGKRFCRKRPVLVRSADEV